MHQQKIRLDDLPLSPFHFKITALTFGAHLTDGYILGLIGIALTQITPLMGLNSFWQGFIGSSALIGLFLGSLFFGMVADSLGRQKIFLISFVVIALGSLGQFFVTTPLQLALCRIAIGIGLGGDYSVGHALLAEFCPKKYRGPILGSFSVIWTVGYVAATFVGSFAMKEGNPEAWRWMLASSTLPAVIILIARMGAPESPRWLANQGRLEEANAILARLFGPNVILGDEAPATTGGGFMALFAPQYIKRTIFNCMFFVCIVMPYFAIYTFLPMILGIMGLSEGFITEMLLNMLLILGAFIGIWCTIRFTRRGFLINSFIIITTALFLLGLLPDTQNALLIGVFALFTVTLSAMSNLVGVFPAESFPTEIRSSGIGLATAFSRFGSAISTFLLPLCIVHFGIHTTMLILGGVALVGTVISILWAPETKYLSLAQAAKNSVANENEASLLNKSAQEA
ncbi:MFS transporter [Desulfovibrio cuneatus]|uniref:MFS transporter n=1 Tax=Desulfovibrio cuneatus TaxID=159728 RepID=UPI00041B0DCF|nr:MFS transporter [Desulfovibrio cuneatus]